MLSKKMYGIKSHNMTKTYSGNIIKPFTVCLIFITLTVFTSFSGCLNNDSDRENYWALEAIEADIFHNSGFYGQGIKIGIVDTGIELSHREFKDLKTVAWLDIVNNNERPYDDNGHGTMMMSILAGNSSIKGIAPAADYVVIKALDSTGSGSLDNIAEAVEVLINNNVDIIVLSLGGRTFPIRDTSAERSVKKAIDNGIIVVASAGNNGPDNTDVASPSSVEGAISVGALDRDYKIGNFSSGGRVSGGIVFIRYDPNKKPEITAPGVDINTAYPGNKYTVSSGTSHAAAYAGGALALILQYTEFNPDDIDDIFLIKRNIMNSAMKSQGQATPHDRYYGYGLIRAHSAAVNITA